MLNSIGWHCKSNRIQGNVKGSQKKISKRIFACAGEVSGDRILGQALRALHIKNPSCSAFLEIQGIGGEASQKEGLQSWWSLSLLAKNGVWDILLYSPMLLWILGCTFVRLKKWKPDLVLLVDYPGFNIVLLKWCLQKKIPVYYIAPPQLWAYKRTSNSYQKRQKVFKNVHVQVLFPMEVPHYAEVTPFVYQGHFFSQDFFNKERILDMHLQEVQKSVSRESNKYVCLCPGSRWPSIKRNLSIWVSLMEQSIHLLSKNLEPCFMVPEECYETVKHWVRQRNLSWPVFSDRNWGTVTLRTQAVVAFPGTVTLRWALHKKPVFVFGIVDRWTYKLAIKRLVTPFLSLPNILCGREVCQEWVVCSEDASLPQFQQYLSSLLKNSQKKEENEEEHQNLLSALGNNQGPTLVAEQVWTLLEQSLYNKKL